MKSKKIMAMLLTLTCALTVMTGCGSKNTAGDEGTSTEKTTAEVDSNDANKKLNGSITLSGSTSMEKISNAVAEAFMQKYSGVTVTAEFTGSGAGIEAVTNGTVDIGNSSRELKDSEKEAGVAENIVAIDGIAVIVNNSNGVSDLTKEQLIDIYAGNVTNWQDLGGSNEPIIVIGRESGSGTRGAFEEILDVKDQCKYANELDNTGAVLAKVSAIEGAIGYVSLDVVDDTVKAVNLEGIEATAQNIIDGKYFLSRPFVMATKGEIGEQSDLIQAFFDYIYSDEGSEIVEQVGLIPVQNK